MSGSKKGTTNIVNLFYGGGYSSEPEKGGGARRRDNLPSSNPIRTGSHAGYSSASSGGTKFSSLAAGFGSAQSAAGRVLYGGGPYAGMDAYTRHRQMMLDYSSYASAYNTKMEEAQKLAEANQVTDRDVLIANHQFIRDTEKDAAAEATGTMTWEQRMAKKYYDKLFKVKDRCLSRRDVRYSILKIAFCYVMMSQK
jgi:hypothetical protein